MTTIKLNNALKTSLPFLGKWRLAGLFLFFLIQISFAQPNNSKQEFDLNDPRNPDCPCHKYQKMADEEFRKTQKENKLNQEEKKTDIEQRQNFNVQKIQVKDMKQLSDSGHSEYSKNKKRKRLTNRVNKYLKFFILKPSKTTKVKPRYSICFKW